MSKADFPSNHTSDSLIFKKQTLKLIIYDTVKDFPTSFSTSCFQEHALKHSSFSDLLNSQILVIWSESFAFHKHRKTVVCQHWTIGKYKVFPACLCSGCQGFPCLCIHRGTKVWTQVTTTKIGGVGKWASTQEPGIKIYEPIHNQPLVYEPVRKMGNSSYNDA